MSVIKPALQYPDQIVYLSGANNYSWIYFRGGEKKLLAKSISYLEGKLPDFIRVHKTLLINPTYIKSILQPPRKKMTGKVCLDGGEVFPISRRRWSQVIESLQTYQASISRTDTRNNSVVDAPNLPIEPASIHPVLSICLITANEESALQAEQIMKEEWPAYQFYTNPQSTYLPDLLNQLPERQYPVLLLLDARTLTRERLSTLQRLKQDKNLSRIPVILLVLPADQLVIDGYQHQANSVVSIPITGSEFFSQTILRICQFWLNFVKLPGIDHPNA